MSDIGTLEHPAFVEIDRQFARLMERLSGARNSKLALAAALASWNQRQGNICLDLNAVATRPFPEAAPDAEGPPLELPPLTTWLPELRNCSVIGRPGEFKPLILDARERLYLQRSWQYESDLARSILERASATIAVDDVWLGEALNRYFPAGDGDEVDWQRLAALTAVKKKLCLISGGPGTGKTRTVAVLLAILLEQAGAGSLRIALAAPTGKAAARLQESIKNVKTSLPWHDDVKARLPEEAFTLHRLLGSVPDSTRFKHDASSPLPFDVIVVDEASMVDLALMAKLFYALPERARVILLGDKDQLASVEAGAVLGDICFGAALPAPRSDRQGELSLNLFPCGAAEPKRRRSSRRNSRSRAMPGTSLDEDGARPAGADLPTRALSECIVHLQKNYRFGSGSGILALSRAVKDGDTERALQCLRTAGETTGDIGWKPLPSAARLKENLRERVLTSFREVRNAGDPRAALMALGRFRILCALRQGPFGAGQINAIAEEILVEADLIRGNERWYAGRPVMILQNDYNLRLFNGDVGILLPDPESGQMRVFFLGAKDELRRFAPARLPAHETVFAMTVHKSQGSEFEDVLLILPDRESPVLTREMIYTGITRASRSAEVWLDEAVFRSALSRRVDRASGLREALWG